MTTDTDLRTLPVSGLPVGPQAFAVSKIRTWKSYDGGGVDATVTLDGKPVGEIVDEGTGGGAYFRPTSSEARVAWEAFVKATPAYDLDPTREFGEGPCMVDGEEGVAELLVQEAIVAKKIRAAVKKGRVVFVEPGQDRRSEFTSTVAPAPDFPEGTLVWNGTEYVAAGR